MALFFVFFVIYVFYAGIQCANCGRNTRDFKEKNKPVDSEWLVQMSSEALNDLTSRDLLLPNLSTYAVASQARVCFRCYSAFHRFSKPAKPAQPSASSPPT